MNFAAAHSYWLNFIVHSTAFAMTAWLAVMGLRHPRTRAAAAFTGLLAVGLIPWLSAIRVQEKELPAALQAPVQALPGWRITLKEASAPSRPAVPSPAAIASTPDVGAIGSVPTAPPSGLWSMLGIVWAGGVVIGLSINVLAAWKLRNWCRSLPSSSPDEWREISSLTDLPRDAVRICETAVSPCVTGFFSPRLILPRFLLASSERTHLSWAIRHESAHLDGRDLRWLAMFRIIRSALWWNPFVHLLLARWSEAREQLCDLHAVGTDEDRANYSRFLIEIGGRPSAHLPGALAMADRSPVSRLKRRLIFLLTSPADRKIGKGFIGAVLLLLLACGIALPSFGVDSPAASAPNPGAGAAVIEVPTAAIPITVVESKNPEEEVKGAGVEEKNPQLAEVPQPIAQVKISTKIVFSDQSPGKHGEVLRNVDYEKYFATLVTQPGNKLETWPSVTARAGQEASIEIIRENPAFALPPPTAGQIAEAIDKDEEISPWIPKAYWSPNPPQVLGFVLNIHPEIIKDHLHLTTRAIFSQVPGVEVMTEPKSGNQIAWKEVRRFDVDLATDLNSGDLVICSFGEIRPGRHLTLFIRAESIDATGKPAPGGFGGPFPAPPQPVPAAPAPIFTATGVIFDFDKPQAKPPEGAPPMSLIGVFTERQFERLKRKTSAKVRDLPAMKLTSRERRTQLWHKEVPRFWLGAMGLENGGAIDLDLRGATFPGQEPAFASEGSVALYDGQYAAIVLAPPPGVARRVLYVKVAIDKLANK